MSVEETTEDQNTRLAMALLDDDEEALAEILRCYGPAIIKSLSKKFVDHKRLLRYEDIEDVVAIALKRLWDARADYNDKKQSLRVWFYCLAANAAKDVLKHGWHKAYRLERNPGSDWLDEKEDRSSVDPEEPPAKIKAVKSKLATDLESVLNKMSDVQRIIVLADAAAGDGKASTEHLADELAIPAAHVRVNRQRGNAFLRREMKNLGHDIPESRDGQ